MTRKPQMTPSGWLCLALALVSACRTDTSAERSPPPAWQPRGALFGALVLPGGYSQLKFVGEFGADGDWSEQAATSLGSGAFALHFRRGSHFSPSRFETSQGTTIFEGYFRDRLSRELKAGEFAYLGCWTFAGQQDSVLPRPLGSGLLTSLAPCDARLEYHTLESLRVAFAGSGLEREVVRVMWQRSGRAPPKQGAQPGAMGEAPPPL